MIDDKNQIRALPENATLTFAGSLKMGEISQNILFLSTTYTVSEDNVINFTVDTYTEPFLNQIKKKNTEINVEISIKFEDGHQKLLLRDYAYACPRVYIEGVPPTPVESYYTKDEVDSLINGVIEDIPTKTSELINDSGYITSSQIDLSDYYTKEETNTKLSEKADLSSLADYQPISGMNVYALNADIPTKTSELTNDSGFITSSQIDLSDYYDKPEIDVLLAEKADLSSLNDYQPVSGMNIYALKSEIPSGGSSTGDSYTFPLEQRTFICMSESVSEDGSIEMHQIDSEYNRSSGNRYINDVVVIPSGAPSGKVDFVYEETSGFVYNPFTTVKFQLDCIPSKEMSSLQEIYFIVEKAGEETVIATTEGLNSNTIHRYNSQNDNSIFCSQVIELKNILADEFVSVIGDKVKLRFLFAYRYFGTSSQKNAPSDQKQQFTVSVGDTKNGRYCFFLSINKSFSNSDLPHDPLKYYATINGVTLAENVFDHSQIRYPMDALQKRNLAFMLNDTGIFGKVQNTSYAYDEYHYHFNNYIDYSQDYSLYDDIYLNGKFDSRR